MYSVLRHCIRRLGYSSCKSPIHGLPVEILSHIFNLTTHTTAFDEQEDETQHKPLFFDSESVRTPLILAAVCRHWRQVAHGTASLWTSLCITPELLRHHYSASTSSSTCIPSSTTLELAPVLSYLSLSRNYPLNILVDARDRDWDFSEVGVTSYMGSHQPPYSPPFHSDHMRDAIAVLLPHLGRWKTLTILTDTWAPMHTALGTINPCLTATGAPILESLTLMRCNDFVSYSPDFQPSDLKNVSFLSSSPPKMSGPPRSVLPRLKHLSLRGVHVNWSALARSLELSSSLVTLELASHCTDVRPTTTTFRRLLSSSRQTLRSLAITGSGPPVDFELEPENHDLTPGVSLPFLRRLKMGYRDEMEGLALLRLLDAPSLRELKLEDSTYPGDPEEIDATNLIRTIAEHNSNLNTQQHGQFPLLQRLSLRGIKAWRPHFTLLFLSFPQLSELELSNMAMHAVDALLPCRVPLLGAVTTTTEGGAADSRPFTCPCPRLSSLTVRGILLCPRPEDGEFIRGGLSALRESYGAIALRNVQFNFADRLEYESDEGEEEEDEEMEEAMLYDGSLRRLSTSTVSSNSSTSTARLTEDSSSSSDDEEEEEEEIDAGLDAQLRRMEKGHDLFFGRVGR